MDMMSIQEIGELLGVALTDTRPIHQVHFDGRLCLPNSLYVALKGGKVDGHQFLSQAAEKGAIAAIVDRGYSGPHWGLTLLPVEEPLQALHHLARVVLKRRKPFIIGITGSIGKTTVKEFTAELLATTYQVAKSPDSYNGQLGLPVAILNADPKANVLVLEMGMSYAGEMVRLVGIAPPDFAVITRVAPAHLGYFNSVEEIAYEKAQLLQSPHLKASLIHKRNTVYPCMLKEHFQMTYSGLHADAFLKPVGEEILLVDKRRNEECLFSLPFHETHLLENFLAAALVAREMQIPYADLQERASTLKPFKHRFEKSVLQNPEGVVLIDDSYNNNPVSLKTSLQNVSKYRKSGKVVAVIGQMRELGKASKMAHEEIAFVALPIVDCLLTYGPEAEPLYEAFARHGKKAEHFLDKDALTRALIALIGPEDVLFVKGANSNRLWEVLEKLKEHFSPSKIC